LGPRRELAALLEISQTATQSLETEKIFNDTLDKSLEILDFDVGYIRSLDAEKKNLIVRVARGPDFLIVGKTVFKTQKTVQDPDFTARTMERVISLAIVPTVFEQCALVFLAAGE